VIVFILISQGNAQNIDSASVKESSSQKFQSKLNPQSPVVDSLWESYHEGYLLGNISDKKRLRLDSIQESDISDSVQCILNFSHSKGFVQCSNKTLQWAEQFGKTIGGTITKGADSGMVQIFSAIGMGSVASSGSFIDTCSYNLFLTSGTNSLKIKFKSNPGPKSCLSIIPFQITELVQSISSLPDSMIICTIKNNTFQDSIKEQIGILKKDLEQARTFSRYARPFGAITLLAGVVAGIVTIADVSGHEDFPIAVDNHGKVTKTVTIQHEWTKYHTIWITLSLSAITGGISLLCR
jgi:hypothetical protein